MSRVLIVPLSVLLALFVGRLVPAGDAGGAASLRAFLVEHFEQRAAALYSGEMAPALAAQIDLSHPHGRWLLEHEQRKAAHLHAWLRSRGYVLSGRQVEVKVLRVRSHGSHTATASVIFRLGLDYRPARAATGAGDRMGVGTSHVVQLVRRDGRWLVQQDHALDPLYEYGAPPGAGPRSDGQPPPAAAPGGAAEPAGSRDGAAEPAGSRDGVRWQFDRERASRYADTYCGIAFGCGNGHRYNRQYRDYTGLGGDCANFVSQVLTAGGLRPGGGWFYDGKRREASAAWINAGSLVRYLVHSGRAQLLARGSFTQVTRSAGGPGLPRLAPGDVIGYEVKGDVVHVSVVAGVSGAGYAVVNSHTADRYHVPWDLGWGEQTRFWLLRVRG